LQGYIDGELDQTTAQEVSQHLQSCAKCAKELEYLKQYLSNMKGLETVGAPEDFLERVHRRIEEIPGKRRLFHTLFFPIRFKIPLELSAVAAMVIAVIFVLQVTRPVKREAPGTAEQEINITRALPDEKHEEVKAEKPVQSILQKKELQPPEGAAVPEGSVADKTTVSLEKTPAPELKTESKEKGAEALREGGESGSLTELTVVMVLPGELENEEEALKATSTAAARAPAEYDKMLSTAPAEAAKGEEETYRSEQAEKAPGREKTAMVSKTQGEESTGIRASLRTAEEAENPALQKAVRHVADLVQSEGGTVVEKSFPKTPDQPIVITADIPDSNINNFLDQLGDYGNVQIPPIGEAEKKAFTVRIRIEIRLPAR